MVAAKEDLTPSREATGGPFGRGNTIAGEGPAASVRSAFAVHLLLLLLVACFIVYDAARPLDYRTSAAWREADYGQISRNFVREGLNPFYARVDWRGETSGLTESEFPALPWVTALCVKSSICDYRHIRYFSASASLLSIMLMWLLARGMLDPTGAMAAAVFFGTNTLFLRTAASAQPEPGMLTLMLVAALFLFHWYRNGLPSVLLSAGLCLGLAVMAKGSAIAIGPLFAYAALRRLGPVAALRSKSVWAAALLAVGPPVAWYFWTHQHYLQTGLSLGLSNETHIISWQALPVIHRIAWANLQTEVKAVFAVIGLLLSVVGIAQMPKVSELPCAWYVGIVLFYTAIANTSGDGWATYYHLLSVPPAALLVGAGVTSIASGLRRRGLRWGVAIASIPLVAVVAIALRATYHSITYRDNPSRGLAQMYTCHLELAKVIPPGQRVLLRGGVAVDELGQPVAYNASMGFWWLDRKGDNYPRDQTSLEDIQRLVHERNLYWVTEPEDLQQFDPDGRSELGLREVARCSSDKGFRVYAAVVRSGESTPGQGRGALMEPKG